VRNTSFLECFTIDYGRRFPGMTFKDYLWHFLFDAGYKAVVLYRLSRYFSSKKFPPFNKGVPFLHRAIFMWSIKSTACEISYNAEIEEGFWIPHSTGIVVGAGVKIGRDVTMYSNVTLGARERRADAEPVSQGASAGTRYPVIGDNVIIYTGVRILGPVTIGEGSVVGANAVVLSSFPADSVIVGVPARDVSGR